MRNAIRGEKQVATTLNGGLEQLNVTGVLGCSLLRYSFNIFICFPDTDDEVTKLIDKFIHHSWIQQVIGVADGTHIAIKAPKENPDDYYNRKGHHSVLLQGNADSE